MLFPIKMAVSRDLQVAANKSKMLLAAVVESGLNGHSGHSMMAVKGIAAMVRAEL